MNFSILQNGKLLFSGAIQNRDLQPEEENKDENEFVLYWQASLASLSSLA